MYVRYVIIAKHALATPTFRDMQSIGFMFYVSGLGVRAYVLALI